MYHLYVDEIGHTSYATSNRPNHRYLSLTGLIIDKAEEPGLQRQFDAFRREQAGHTSEVPIILHRSEMGGKKGLGKILRDRDNREAFENGFVELVGSAPITLINVTIDRVAFYYKHESWVGDPYEFCATMMIERYCLFLHHRNAQGMVSVEGRNPSEDEQFKTAFQRLCEEGTDFMSSGRVRHILGHSPITVASKRDDVMCIQLADFLCQPMLEACIRKFRGRGKTSPFNKRLIHAAWPKIYRNRLNIITGCGLVWRPK